MNCIHTSVLDFVTVTVMTAVNILFIQIIYFDLSSNMRPSHVGILAIEVYTPRQRVDQSELETKHGCKGKYEEGLGQHSMSFTSDREDAVSLALTVVSRLMEKHAVSPHRIGRLEVGTESQVDRSKSIKSYLMELFEDVLLRKPSGKPHPSLYCSIEGTDAVHGCYGGTQAVLNSIAWIESSGWDGRLALVVCSDIAAYAPGSAAVATGGCGAVAILIGPEAPLALDPEFRATYSHGNHDFLKPIGSISPFPSVDGAASCVDYLMSADKCYANLREKILRAQVKKKRERIKRIIEERSPPLDEEEEEEMESLRRSLSDEDEEPAPLDQCDYAVFHAPFNKLVRKCLGRLKYQDVLAKQHRFSEAEERAAVREARRRSTRENLAADDDPGLASSTSPSVPSMSPSPETTPVKGANGSHGSSIPSLTPLKPESGSTPTEIEEPEWDGALEWVSRDPSRLPPSSYQDRALQQGLLDLTARQYQIMVEPGAWVQKCVGNSYTASVWMALAGLVERAASGLINRRILMFSFGSGTICSFLGWVGRDTIHTSSLHPNLSPSPYHQRFNLESISSKMGLSRMLDERESCPVDEFELASELLLCSHLGASGGSGKPYQPFGSIKALAAGAYYLDMVLENGKRIYKRKP